MNPTQNQTETGVVQDLAELLGMRTQLLAKVSTVKLADADKRLVLFGGEPVGIIRRQSGKMLWFSSKRFWPYYSINDAALSLVGNLYKAKIEGGMPAVRKLLAGARKEAIQLGARLQALELEEAEA